MCSVHNLYRTAIKTLTNQKITVTVCCALYTQLVCWLPPLLRKKNLVGGIDGEALIGGQYSPFTIDQEDIYRL